VSVAVRSGHLIAALGGLTLLISLFLPWYTREVDIAGALLSSSWSAWASVPVTAAILFGVAGAALALPAGRAIGLPLGGLRVDRVLVALGLLALMLVIWRIASIPGDGLDTVPGDRADDGRAIGLLLALLGAAAVLAGGRVSKA
jgi:hypothetical protein